MTTLTNGRLWDWMQTAIGRSFWPLDPRAQNIVPWEPKDAKSAFITRFVELIAQ